jgi:hypothetical protein
MLLRTFLLLIIVAVLAVLLPASAQTVSVPIGDTLPLSGTAPGADTVYLFLTGPNLPPNGLKLDDISVPVITGVPSTFVQVPVAADDTWKYSWSTRTRGGVLDAGIYTVFVVTSPTGRLDLSGRDTYAVIAVDLTRPTLTIIPNGGLTITSEPSGANVLIDGVPEGATPLDLANVSAGEHSIEIQKEGYLPATGNVMVIDGENTTVTQTLVPETTPVASIPLTASPTTSIPLAGTAPLLALGIGLLAWKSRKI